MTVTQERCLAKFKNWVDENRTQLMGDFLKNDREYFSWLGTETYRWDDFDLGDMFIEDRARNRFEEFCADQYGLWETFE
jgi:hypothetical protein